MFKKKEKMDKDILDIMASDSDIDLEGIDELLEACDRKEEEKRKTAKKPIKRSSVFQQICEIKHKINTIPDDEETLKLGDNSLLKSTPKKSERSSKTDLNTQELQDMLSDKDLSYEEVEGLLSNNSDEDSSIKVDLLSPSKKKPKRDLESPCNSYDSMRLSNLKMKESIKKLCKNEKEVRLVNEIEETANFDKLEPKSDSKSMLGIYRKESANKNQHPSPSKEGKEKKQFMRYFSSNKKDNKQSQYMDYEVGTQKDDIKIGEEINPFLMDDISEGDLEDLSLISEVDIDEEDESTTKIASLNEVLKTYIQFMGSDQGGQGSFKLFDWQNECLRLKDVMYNGASFIYSAPTSAGKSLVSEIIMLNNALKYREKLVIVIYPFISLINEKEKKYSKLFKHYGLDAISVHSGKFGRYEQGETNIMMCTIEKANGFLNKITAEFGLEELSKRISTVIIDEFHTIGDHYRGFFIESMITKLLYSKNFHKFNPIQIIGMSATLPNLDEVCNWMDATLYMTDFRPVEVKEYILCIGKVYSTHDFINRKYDSPLEMGSKEGFLKNNKYDKYKMLPLILETVMNKIDDSPESARTGSVLIFCSSKMECQIICKNLCHTCDSNGVRINSDIIQEIIEKEKSGEYDSLSKLSRFSKRSDLPPGNYKLTEHIEYGIKNMALKNMIKKGFAYHHSGLKNSERLVIERAFREGLIKALFCTSTLAAGVNLPAKRVIITSIKQGKDIMSDTTYKQMAGRAGRYGLDTSGESFLICTANEKEQVENIIGHDLKLKSVKSCLGSVDKGMRKMILDCVCSQIVKNDLQFKHYLQQTFYHFQLQNHFIKSLQDQNSSTSIKGPTLKTKRMAWYETLQTGKNSMEFLINNEIIIEEKLKSEITNEEDPLILEDLKSKPLAKDEQECRIYKSTKLGKAILASGLLPEEGLIIYLDLLKAQKSLVLQHELQLLYLLTPVSMPEIRVKWDLFQKLFKNLSSLEMTICEKIQIDLAHIQTCSIYNTQNKGLLEVKQFQKHGLEETEKNYEFSVINKQLIQNLKHVRFYLTLILKDLISNNSVEEVARKYGVSTGAIQTLKKRATFLPNVICSICKELEWFSIFHILSQFQDRVNFDLQEDLEDLMKVKYLDISEARAIYECGFTEMKLLAKAKPIQIYKSLQSAFIPEKQYSTNIEDYLFKPTTAISCASVYKAEQIIKEAKAIMKQRRRNLTLQQQKQRMEWFKKQKQERMNKLIQPDSKSKDAK
ncbi:unnamed protein product [Moneuplotes crassus]|uniref:Uncharacterized protein n=1 Tax=Euplotes crassus TaxID=5936 RepID=A0AAD1UDT3_EUPCR|nr:unnamed protein product [Moneuplotes crassus]